MTEYRPIADYAVIGNGHSAALVGRDGSIDWLCWPFFDSPSVFARILDIERGGFFSIRPRGRFDVERKYIDGTNILQTTFRTNTGVALLIDLMPAPSTPHREQNQPAVGHVLRRIEGVEGEVAFDIEFRPRPDYARAAPRYDAGGPNLVRIANVDQAVSLRSDVPLTVDGEAVRASATLRAGEAHNFVFGLRVTEADTEEEVRGEIAHTVKFWRGWSSQVRHDSPYGDLVLRSALALKLLQYSPTGAIVAAPTTSLPEAIGGVRNWDYRYCWLRDASFTVRALFDAGFHGEAKIFVNWLVQASERTQPDLQVLYGIRGESEIDELFLDHLQGYRGSRPVRIGNDAHRQFQLDIYGELLGAIDRFAAEGKEIPPHVQQLIRETADLVARRWREPDHGIWEIRSAPRQHVHSKAMTWMALNCAQELVERWGVRADTTAWRKAQKEIRELIMSRGVDRHRHHFVATIDGNDVDASLLYLSRVGIIDPQDPIMRNTIDAVRARLAVGDVICRYRDIDDGLPGREGAFLAASFWLVESLALAGLRDKAHETFERLIRHGNDVGLFSEEIDPRSDEFLGNYPQALTHIALMNCAMTLSQSEKSVEAAKERHHQPA